MKKIALLIILFCSISIFHTSAKSFTFGLKGGVTLSSLSFKGDFTKNFNSENRTGFFVGPTANASLPLGFNIDAAVMYARDKVRYENQKGGVTDNRHMIEVPVNLKWQISAPKVIGVYFSAGPDFAFNLNKCGDIEKFIKTSLEKEGVDPSLLRNHTKTVTIGIGVGAGIVLFDHLNLGFNYIFPIDYVYKYTYGDTDLEFTSKAKRLQISAAYIF